jgi:hypothetical protein
LFVRDRSSSSGNGYYPKSSQTGEGAARGSLKLLIYLALPREELEVSNFSHLTKRLGQEPVIEFQWISEALPKPISERTLFVREAR